MYSLAIQTELPSTATARSIRGRWARGPPCDNLGMAVGEDSQATRLVVVVFDGIPLGIMSFTFGVFDMAKHYGVLPDLDVRVVAGEPAAALSGGGLTCEVPYDLGAVRNADLIIVSDWREPGEAPPQPLLEALRLAHAAGARVAAPCSGAVVVDRS